MFSEGVATALDPLALSPAPKVCFLRLELTWPLGSSCLCFLNAFLDAPRSPEHVAGPRNAGKGPGMKRAPEEASG